jgi:hypothetical protein
MLQFILVLLQVIGVKERASVYIGSDYHPGMTCVETKWLLGEYSSFLFDKSIFVVHVNMIIIS